MKPVRFDDYRDRYDCISMRREDGILEIVIHARVYTPGINLFNAMLAKWREKGDLEGLQLQK